MSMTQVGQGVVDGGKDKGWKYGGRGNLTLNVDTQKLGLWPGGFLTVEVEGNFTDSVNNKTGALMPVNSNRLYPTPTAVHNNNLNVPQVSFMHPDGILMVLAITRAEGASHLARSWVSPPDEQTLHCSR